MIFGYFSAAIGPRLFSGSSDRLVDVLR